MPGCARSCGAEGMKRANVRAKEKKMHDVCRCNIPMHQGCAACGGAIPVSTLITMARIEGAQRGKREAFQEIQAAIANAGMLLKTRDDGSMYITLPPMADRERAPWYTRNPTDGLVDEETKK